MGETRPLMTVSINEAVTKIHVTIAGRENSLGYDYWGEGDRQSEIAKAHLDARRWAEYYHAKMVERYS
ncbi:hypothetical protein [Mesorhizobium neociceri]|uniref:Uncharacterized protein n=1 Tax=Mesorhizobium neociceri TaxID=1307853 RepID=A0A838BAR7_9HYPH|nr:hypothetical protein [Mesorhizobium neociceri]MBA1143089.1 hypothetical protein [Mesorhizobium neociceri]